MECATLSEDWTVNEKSLGNSLLEIRRISIKNYLISSISSYTKEELLKIKEGEFLKKMVVIMN